MNAASASDLDVYEYFLLWLTVGLVFDWMLLVMAGFIVVAVLVSSVVGTGDSARAEGAAGVEALMSVWVCSVVARLSDD